MGLLALTQKSDHSQTSIRYAIDRGVWSTPTFLINGNETPQLESSSTLSDWQRFLSHTLPSG